MEVMVFGEGLINSFTSLQTVDLAKLARKVIQSPEDYVFILLPSEWSEWLKLHLSMGRMLLATRTTEEKWQKISNFAEENKTNPLSLISLISAHPDFGSSHKIGILTPYILGDCYAAFFAKEERVTERSEEVKQEIFRFREEQANKPPSS